MERCRTMLHREVVPPRSMRKDVTSEWGDPATLGFKHAIDLNASKDPALDSGDLRGKLLAKQADDAFQSPPITNQRPMLSQFRPGIGDVPRLTLDSNIQFRVDRK